MNCLFINNIFPLFARANSGASVRSMRIIRALAKLGNVDVISFVDGDESDLANCSVIYSKSVSNKKGLLTRKDKLKLIFRHSNPYDVFPVDTVKKGVIDKYVRQKNYDCIVTRYINMVCECGLLQYSDRLIIDIDDDPESAAKMIGEISDSLFYRYYQTLFYSRFVGQATRKILQTTKHSFYSEPRRTYPNADFLPNISFFSEPLPSVEYKSTLNNILFVGNMDYYPNVLSLEYFLRNIFPPILQLLPTVHLRIVGKLNNNKLLTLCQSTPNVVLCGYVEDIKEEYRRCRCAIIPLLHGTGTSLKLIEAMSLNRAVVTTSVGKRGLHEAFVAGEDYLLADNDKDFVDSVLKLLHDENLARQLSANACKKIKKYYSEKMFNDIVKKAIIG